jgi:hypothetical protein
VDDHAVDLMTTQAAWSDAEWEAAWAPYDETTYRAALELIRPDDVVLDIGAGDLRFARRAAAQARTVIAVEQRAELLTGSRPPNLLVICGDALTTPFPPGVTVGVLLMRHCRHFAEYAGKLQSAGCTRLVTNARWRLGIEEVSLAERMPFAAFAAGWYACRCGAVGFKPGPLDNLTPALLAATSEVETCPACLDVGG